MSERKRVEREEKRFQRGNLVENKLQSGNRNEERFQKTCSEKTKFEDVEGFKARVSISGIAITYF